MINDYSLKPLYLPITNFLNLYIKLYILNDIGPPIMVATFDKQSHIKYAAMEISTTLLHVVVQFYPFDMSGTILRRYDDDCESSCNSVHLNIIDFRLILTVILNGCNVTLQNPSTVNVRNNQIYLLNLLFYMNNDLRNYNNL